MAVPSALPLAFGRVSDEEVDLGGLMVGAEQRENATVCIREGHQIDRCARAVSERPERREGLSDVVTREVEHQVQVGSEAHISVSHDRESPHDQVANLCRIEASHNRRDTSPGH